MSPGHSWVQAYNSSLRPGVVQLLTLPGWSNMEQPDRALSTRVRELPGRIPKPEIICLEPCG